MKRPIMFFPVTLLALVVAVGCNQVAPSTAPPKNSASVTYDSVAVLPITGELQIKFQGGPETPKTFLQHEFPEELASEIAKQRGSGAFKVISPAVVQEYQLTYPTVKIRELGIGVGTKTVLLGKAVPGTNEITFQLIVAESGELLWGESFPVSEFKSGNIDRRPALQDQHHIAESVAKEVVNKLTGVQQK
jgi:TolB-like protein